MHPIHLNAFQQFMWQWSQLVPYNSVHIMEIKGHADLSKWQKAILALLQEMNLGIPQFTKKEGTVFFSPITTVAIETSVNALDQHINNEMNRRFEHNELPLRFFNINSENGTYFFGVTYNHWIADANAIRNFMQHLLLRYQNENSSLPPLTLSIPKFNSLYRQHLGWLPSVTFIKEGIRSFLTLSRSYRLKLANYMDFESHSICRTLPDGVIGKLHKFAKSHQASINDVFLSILAKTLGEATANERKSKKTKFLHRTRNQLALGTVVNLRKNANVNLQNTFGMFLSSYTIVIDRPEEFSISQLIKKIGKHTAKIKTRLTAIKNYLALSMALLLCKISNSPESYLKFFYKHTPVAGGISNVNFNDSWEHDVVTNYLRISPAGPLLPLVFSLTTLDNRLSLWMTYRTTAFSQQQAEALCDAFTRYLTAENLL